MKNYLSLVLLILVISFSCVPQKFHTYKSWNEKNQINVSSVSFILEEETQNDANIFMENFAKLLVKKLKENGVNSNYSFNEKSINEQNLKVKLDFIEPAYVYMGGKADKLPLANRIEIKQLNFLSKNKKDNIHTILSISVPEEEQGLSESVITISKSIINSIK